MACLTDSTFGIPTSASVCNLALQVADIDRIVIHDGDAAHARTAQVQRDR